MQNRFRSYDSLKKCTLCPPSLMFGEWASYFLCCFQWEFLHLNWLLCCGVFWSYAAYIYIYVCVRARWYFWQVCPWRCSEMDISVLPFILSSFNLNLCGRHFCVISWLILGNFFLYKLERTSCTPTMTVQHSFVFLKTSDFHDIWNGRLTD